MLDASRRYITQHTENSTENRVENLEMRDMGQIKIDQQPSGTNIT